MRPIPTAAVRSDRPERGCYRGPMNRVPLALLAVFLFACSDGPGDADGGVCEPLPADTRGCCCFSNYPESVAIENSCPEVESCPPIVITCDWGDAECPVPEGSNGPPGAFEVDEAGLECVLRALRDGTPGTLRWTFDNFETGGQYKREVRHHVAADRVVYVTAEDTADQAGVIEDATQQVLQPAEYFADCLQEADLRTRALCLTGTTTGSITATCVEGGSYTNF
jgi:hypothetical protein